MKRMIDDKIINKLSIKNDVLEIDGTVNADKITGDEIVENMNGYSAEIASNDDWTITNIYTSAVKNGNKITFVSAVNIQALVDAPTGEFITTIFNIPASIGQKLYQSNIGGASLLAKGAVLLTPSSAYYNSKNGAFYAQKPDDTEIRIALLIDTTGILTGSTYYVRVEMTFLLSDDLTD